MRLLHSLDLPMEHTGPLGHRQRHDDALAAVGPILLGGLLLFILPPIVAHVGGFCEKGVSRSRRFFFRHNARRNRGPLVGMQSPRMRRV